MDLQAFFDHIQPSSGNYVLALAKPKTDGSGVWFKYFSYPTTAAAAEAAKNLDADGKTVYFGVNTFHDWYHCEKKNKRRIRTQENIAACRSLYDDFDVDPDDPKKYATREEALEGVKALANAVKLTPTITSSGGGFHMYYTPDEDIDEAEWEELSALKRDIAAHLELKTDRAVDMDIARILRPVGMHNRKFDPPREVKVLKLGKTYSVERLRHALETYIAENDVMPAPRPTKGGEMANPFAAALGDHAPSDPELVADRCAAVREFRDTGGDIAEPHWWAAIGVVKHCEGGEDKIHEWSQGYDGYSYQETQQKIEEWSYGPTSCDKMDELIGCKADCPFAEKCKFPIQLGVTDVAPSLETETATAPDRTSTPTTSTSTPTPAPAPQNLFIEGQNIPYWPAAGFRWNGSSLSRAVVDPDGMTTWRPFSQDFVYPIDRVRDSEGIWSVHWRTKEKNGSWREFMMPTAELASAEKMATTMAANEVFLTRTAKARSDMAEFAETLIKKLQEWRIETTTVSQFGWNEKRDGFVIGTNMITAKGEEPVLCDPKMPPDVMEDFGTSGTLDEWVSNIDVMYNRQGAEPLQFALCHSMGSALVELFGSSNWHGLPLAFTGHGGTGKSTACKIACGFYGNPEYMERQGNNDGTSLGAAIKRIASMGSVPMVLDEFSGRTPEELTRTAYALANGRDKERLNTRGGYATVGDVWFKNSFITSNDSLHESISKLPAGYKVEATQLRFFEVQLPKHYIEDIFSDITQSFVEDHMNNVYGEACRPFLRFLIKNQDWVRRQIVAAREKLNPKSAEDNQERFYRDAIVTAWVAGKIAHKLGLVKFDVGAMKNWALNHVLQMRENRKELNVDTGELLAQFIASLAKRLITTPNFTSNGMQYVDERAIQSVAGRICTTDKLAFIAHSVLKSWCAENGVAPATLIEEMDRLGLIVWQPDGKKTRKMRLGTGTTVPTGPQTCYELDYDNLFGKTSLKVVRSAGDVKTEVEEAVDGSKQ